MRKWSDTTLKTVASKYLTFMKKTDFVTGRQKKKFRYVHPDIRAALFFSSILNLSALLV